MASLKKSVPSGKADNDCSNPLEGPVSLLWAYQLRREHALLLSRVDSLVDTVRQDNTSTQLERLNIDLKAMEDRIIAAEKEVDSHRFDLQAIRASVSGGDEAVAEIRLQIAESERHHKEEIENFVTQQKIMSTQVVRMKAEGEKTLESKLCEQREQIHLLQRKTVELEDQVKQLSGREKSVMKDSIEEVLPANITVDFKKSQLVNNSNVSNKIGQRRHKRYSHADDLLQDLEEEDSNMLTLYPIQRREETPATEFDLDAGLATMSYVRSLRHRKTPDESMAMLPELLRSKGYHGHDGEFPVRVESQSWEHYLGEGRALVMASEKRKEGAIVDNFVTVIADPVLRAACEQWLDERVWIWEHIENFAAHHDRRVASPEPSSTADSSPRPHRVGGKKISKGLADSQAVGKELARLLENQGRRTVEFQVVAESQGPDGKRRSQRLAKKNDEVSQQIEAVQHIPETNSKSHRHVNNKEGLQKPRNQREKVINNAESHSKISGQFPASRQAASIKITKAKQLVASEEPRSGRRGGCTDSAKGLNGPANVDGKAHAHQQGGKDLVDIVILSTPTPINRCADTLSIAQTKALGQRTDPDKTPQDRLFIGRKLFKRKLEPSEQDWVASTKRARTAKRRKRGPPPSIPILPSSDTD